MNQRRSMRKPAIAVVAIAALLLTAGRMWVSEQFHILGSEAAVMPHH